jgi:hypothetical protein
MKKIATATATATATVTATATATATTTGFKNHWLLRTSCWGSVCRKVRELEVATMQSCLLVAPIPFQSCDCHSFWLCYHQYWQEGLLAINGYDLIVFLLNIQNRNRSGCCLIYY